MQNEIGYSVFLKAPGKYEQMRCKICGSICDVRRNELGVTCWAEAMAGHKRLHDRFECPHIHAKWHDRCVIQYWTWRNSESCALSELGREDLLALLEDHVDAEGIWFVTALMKEKWGPKEYGQGFE